MFFIWIPATVLVVWAVYAAWRRPLWGLYTVMAAIPFSYKPGLQGTPLYFLVELVLLPFAAGLLIRYRHTVWRVLLQSPFLALLPFLAFVALSCLWANNDRAVVKEVVRWSEFVLVGLLTGYVITRREAYEKIPSFLAWVGAIVSVVGTAQFLQGINQMPYRPGAASLGHPNPTAAFLGLCILPTLGLVMQSRGWRLWLNIALFVIMLLGLAFTFSRGVILACAIGGGFLLFDTLQSRVIKRHQAVMVLGGFFAALGILAISPHFRHTAMDRVIKQSVLSERQYIFAFGGSVYTEQPWLGVGAGNLKSYAIQHDLHVRETEPFVPNYEDLHNLFLQLAVELGLLGLVFFLGGLTFIGFDIARGKLSASVKAEPLYRSLWAATLTYLLANCSGLYTVKGIHLIWAILLALQAAMTQVHPLRDD